MAEDEQQPPGGAVALRPAQDVAMTARAITGWTPQEVIGNATAIADQLKDVVEKNGMSVSLDRRNPDRKHLEIGAWQTAGTLLGALGGQALHAETVWSRAIADGMGEPEITEYTQRIKRYHKGGGIREEITAEIKGKSYEARVEVKTASGAVLGTAEGQCDRTESTWATRDDFALRSMAETRAESRAYRRAIGWIFQLAGYTTTPAEEMGHDETRGPSGPTFGAALAKERRAEALEALMQILERAGAADPRELAGQVMQNFKRVVAHELGDAEGYIPAVAVDLLLELAKAHAYAAAQQVGEQQPQTPPGEDGPGGPQDDGTMVDATVVPETLEQAQQAMRDAMAAGDVAAMEAAQARARALMPEPQAEPVAEHRQPNSVPLPVRAEGMSNDQWLNRLRSVGCICPKPIHDPPKYRDDCPIVAHNGDGLAISG